MKLPFDADEACEHLRQSDRRLAKVIDRVGPFALQLESLQSPFQALFRAIVYQQLSGHAARAIHERAVLALGDARGPKPEALAEVDDATLRAAGLSRNKVLALRDLAAKTLDGTVPTLPALKKLDDAAIVERLVQVRGIGPWTVEMLLIFRLGRPDVLPVADLGVRRGFMETFGLDALPAPADLLARGERWRPYRSVASWYLWRACDVQKKTSPAKGPR